MEIDNNLTLAEIVKLVNNLQSRKSELVAQQRSTELLKTKETIVLYDFTAKELELNLNPAKSGKKASDLPVKYYDPETDAYWHGRGPIKAAFKEANEAKQMDQYLISDNEATQIAQKIKKDVKTISGDTVKFVDVSNQSTAQMAA